MMDDIGSQFRALHVKGAAFILANVWDTGSARMLAALGAEALATSSAAHAFTLGRADGTISRDEALAHGQQIAAATPLPVQGDFENGWGDDPDSCAETVRLAAEAGLAGICLEDTALPTEAPYPFDLAVERMRAAAAAARALRRDFVLTARADGVLRGSYGVDEAIRRLQAYEAAGADCLYAPLLPSMAETARVVASLSAPVNVLIAGPNVAEPRAAFQALGAARLSLGSSLARATQRLIADAAGAMFDNGNFEMLGKSISGAKVDGYLTQFD